MFEAMAETYGVHGRYLRLGISYRYCCVCQVFSNLCLQYAVELTCLTPGILEYGGGRHAILLKDPIKFAQVCLRLLVPPHSIPESGLILPRTPTSPSSQPKSSTPPPSRPSRLAPSSSSRGSSLAANSAFCYGQ